MLVGYNTNVPYKGTLYHVQTEDNGIKNPVIITLLYYKGTILASKKISYSHLAGSPDYKEKVREIMKEQHKNMMKELIRGKYTGGETAVEPEQETAELQAEQMPETLLDEPHTAEVSPAAEESLPASTDNLPPSGQEEDSKRQISKSLDDILLDFIIKRKG